MNHEPHKLRHEERQESTAEQQQQHQSQAKEYSSAEEMIRDDAANTLVPPQIAVRLNESISREPKPQKSWWKRLFGAGS